MWFLVIGLILVVLKLVGVAPVDGWPWWGVLSPFGLTVVWWFVADAAGLTAKREQKRWLERREKRRREALDKLSPQKGPSTRRIQREDPTIDDRR